MPSQYDVVIGVEAMMRALLAICCVVLSSSCSPVARYSGLPASDVSSLKIGATRVDVERQIGKSQGEKPVCQGMERSYTFNRGMAGDMSFWQATFTEAGLIILSPGVPIDLLKSVCLQACQRGLAKVTYDHNDVVIGYNLIPYPTTGCPHLRSDPGAGCDSIQSRGITPIVLKPPPDCELKEPERSS